MSGFEIVKPAVDVGTATNHLALAQTFWGDTVGLRYDHLLKVGGGVHQHRYDLHGAVLKLNHHRAPLDEAPSGFVALTTVGSVSDTRLVRGPDELPVTLVSSLPDDLRTEIHVEVADHGRAHAAWTTGLGAAADGDDVRIGETRLELREVPDRPRTQRRDGPGIRYLTIQVRDVEAAHAHALAHDLTEGLAPVRLGDTAYISFVRLPDGDWIELSQRASLTGPLPEVDNRIG